MWYYMVVLNMEVVLDMAVLNTVVEVALNIQEGRFHLFHSLC